MTKRKIKNHPPSQRWKKYTTTTEKLERAPTCPKCGPGIFLARHNNRHYCGKCHYVQMKEQQTPPPTKSL